ncbi:hypothetical protein HaLaN_31157 [Haematococcus lacustris]|uniref:Uncharacterized protein n=1 Tax=Haematococcus lacustris TaxID=44745 RepID=A0A6A0AI59_HAELA|nr:hypothetical protein HaLaN_31157 [Haematococcus lacustris]
MITRPRRPAVPQLPASPFEGEERVDHALPAAIEHNPAEMSPRSVRMGAIAALVLLPVTWPIAQGRLQNLENFDAPAAADAHPHPIRNRVSCVCSRPS